LRWRAIRGDMLGQPQLTLAQWKLGVNMHGDGDHNGEIGNGALWLAKRGRSQIAGTALLARDMANGRIVGAIGGNRRAGRTPPAGDEPSATARSVGNDSRESNNAGLVWRREFKPTTESRYTVWLVHAYNKRNLWQLVAFDDADTHG